MKLSERTLSVLKNFSSINKSLVVKQGNILRTMSGNANIIGKAVVDESFPTDFAIYEMSKLLGSISLFKDPDFEFFDDHLKISQGKNNIRITYAAETAGLITAPNKDLVLPSQDIYFELPEKDIESITKATSILQVPEMNVVGEDGTIYVKAANSKDFSGDQFSIAVGVTSASFNLVFKAEYLKFLPGDYKVSISNKGLAQFDSDNMTYWLATEANSKFGV